MSYLEILTAQPDTPATHTDLTLGTITVPAPPRHNALRQLASSIVRELDWDIQRTTGLTDADIIAQLHTHRIRRLTIDDASHISPKPLQWARDITLAANTTLTLIYRRPRSRSVQHWLRNHPTRTLRQPPTPPVPPTEHQTRAFPVVPNSDWYSFRTDTSDLPTRQHRTVDRTYLAALHQVRDDMNQRQPDERVTIVSILRQRLTGVDDPDETLTILRAAQATMFEHGWIVDVRPGVIRARLPKPDHSNPYGRPTATLAIAANRTCFPLHELATATIADATRLATQLRAGAAAIDAQALARRLNGATDTDPLLINTQARQPATVEHLRHVLRRHLPGPPHQKHQAWTQQLGISIRPLPHRRTSAPPPNCASTDH